jgi:predicted ATPase
MLFNLFIMHIYYYYCQMFSPHIIYELFVNVQCRNSCCISHEEASNEP